MNSKKSDGENYEKNYYFDSYFYCCLLLYAQNAEYTELVKKEKESEFKKLYASALPCMCRLYKHQRTILFAHASSFS